MRPGVSTYICRGGLCGAVCSFLARADFGLCILEGQLSAACTTSLTFARLTALTSTSAQLMHFCLECSSVERRPETMNACTFCF